MKLESIKKKIWEIKNVCKSVFLQITSGLNKKSKGEITEQFKMNENGEATCNCMQAKYILEGSE